MKIHQLAFVPQPNHLLQVKANALIVQLLGDGINRPKLARIAESGKQKMLMELVNAQETILLMMENNVCLAQTTCQFGMDINVLHALVELIMTLGQKPAQFVHRDWYMRHQQENVKFSNDYQKLDRQNNEYGQVCSYLQITEIIFMHIHKFKLEISLMKIVLVLALAMVLLNAKQIDHTLTSYQTCCPDTYVLEPVQLRCICPPERPYITADNKCVSCSAPGFWDSTQRVCKGCPPNSWFDEKSSSCVGCPAGFLAVNRNCVCPTSTPYLDANNKCVGCNQPGRWDSASRTCLTCPNSYIYSQNENKCVCPTQAPYVNSANICIACNAPGIWNKQNKQCVTCPAGFLYDQNTKGCKCPSDRPYLTANQVCVSCNAPNYWNVNNKACQSCPKFSHWDSSAGKCVCCPQGYDFDSSKLKCVCNKDSCALPSPPQQSRQNCPEDKPVWNGKTCVACPQHTFFDLKSKTCTVCPEGLAYDASKRECIVTA